MGLNEANVADEGKGRTVWPAPSHWSVMYGLCTAFSGHTLLHNPNRVEAQEVPIPLHIFPPWLLCHNVGPNEADFPKPLAG